MKPWQKKLHVIIYEADTPGGKVFDVALLLAILGSIVAVMLESVPDIGARFGRTLYLVEWSFTILFTIEYVLRLVSVNKPHKYALSFFGLVDLLAIIPTYMSIFFAGSQYLLVIRGLRLLRVFRVLKLAHFLSESRVLMAALRSSRHKIMVFLGAVLTSVMIVGSVMYLIEGEEAGFTSIPKAVYWAIVTMTTVGYGDIVPHTPAGQTIAAMMMVLGYGVIAVPTGIVSVELAEAQKLHSAISTVSCPECSGEGHDFDAIHCKFCGAPLDPDADEKEDVGH
jgi:voltage-gated potassium channel